MKGIQVTEVMQIKTTVKDYHTPISLAKIKKSDHILYNNGNAYIPGGSINWYNHFRKQFGVN